MAKPTYKGNHLFNGSMLVVEFLSVFLRSNFSSKKINDFLTFFCRINSFLLGLFLFSFYCLFVSLQCYAFVVSQVMRISVLTLSRKFQS